MVEDDGFDFGAIDVFAARDDHVLQPIQDKEIPVCVLIADVSGTKEASPEGGRRILRIVPVAAHDVWAAGHQFPALTGLYLFPRIVRDLNFDTGSRSPAGRQSAVGVLLVLKTGEIPGLTEPVNLNQLDFGQ